MKNNWKTKKLSEVCNIKPQKKEVRDRLSEEELVSFLPMNDLGIAQRKVIATQEKKLTEVFNGYTYFADGDVLLAKITPCFENGKLGIARNLKNGIGFGSSEYVVFRPNEELYSDYLFYFLSSDAFRKLGKERMGGAVGHKRVQKDFIENFKIAYPPLPEQKRIVKVLDEVFAGIEKVKGNLEKNLENVKEIFDAELNKVFSDGIKSGWTKDNLKTLTSKIGSGATPRGGRASYKKEGISLVRSMNVYDRFFKEKNLAFIDKSQAEKLSNAILEENDILLNITGASVARSCIIPKEYLPARVNQHVSIIRPKQEMIDSIFLNYLFTSKHYKDLLLGIGEQGATRQAITKTQIEDFLIKYPKSKTDQKSIVKKLDDLSEKTKKLESIYKKKLEDLEELRKSVLKKAFSGEI